jgi:hypothetical protein
MDNQQACINVIAGAGIGRDHDIDLSILIKLIDTLGLADAADDQAEKKQSPCAYHHRSILRASD